MMSNRTLFSLWEDPNKGIMNVVVGLKVVNVVWLGWCDCR
jgi:hypothetical protein